MMGRVGIVVGALLLCTGWAQAQSSPYVVQTPAVPTVDPPAPGPAPTTSMPPVEPTAPLPIGSVSTPAIENSPYVVQTPAVPTPEPPPPGPAPTTWMPPVEPKEPVPVASAATPAVENSPINPVSKWQAPDPRAERSPFIPTVFVSDTTGLTAQPPAESPIASESPRFCTWDSGPAGDTRLWVSAEAVAAWFRGMELPALVTTAPAGTPQAAAGVLNQPTTSLLFGGTVDRDIRAGFRAAAGYWFGEDRLWGIEAGFMMLESQTAFFSKASNGTPILARPFADATNFSSQAVLVAFPNLSTGSIDARAGSANFYEGHGDVALKLVGDGGPLRFDALLGYRFYRYDESLGIVQTLNPLGPLFVAGTQIVSTDGFTTTNEFHGLDLGVRPSLMWGGLSLDLLAKVALGNLRQTVNIAGSQVITTPGAATVTQVGGVFALPTNIGSYTRNELVAFPELGFGTSWHVTPNLTIRLGYSALLLNGIASASDQVNPLINPSRFPVVNMTTGPNQPAFNLRRSDTWIQSITLGVQVSY